MFGAPSNNSPFGAPSNSAPFGSAPTFGAPAPTFGGFGAAPAPTTTTTFGGFGQAPAPTGGFGPAPTTFGGPAPVAGAFGASGAFGGSAGGGFGMKPAGGLFGSAPAPAPTSIFGAPAASSSLFGAPAPAPTGSMFGQAPAPAFGSPAPTFGAPAPAFSSSPFGTPVTSNTSKGSLAHPFQPTTKQDGTTSIMLQSISAMPAYENKSFEELRLEDYLSGNKGSQGQQPQTQTTGFGGFGVAPAPATGLFGAPAPATGLFGAPAPATGLFGAPAPAPAMGGFGGFGAVPAAQTFGAPQPVAATGLFGAPAAAPKPGLFGAAAPAPAFGGFGSTPAPTFGAPQPAPATGLFGALASAPTPAPAPVGGLFGSAPAPAAGGLFGVQAPAPTLMFGAPAPAPVGGGLFGSTAPAPSLGLFGAPAPPPTPVAGGGLFGSYPTPAQSLFGAPAPAPTSLFGAPAAASMGGLFGSPPAAMPPPVVAAPQVPTPSAEVILAQQLAAVENQRKQLELLEAWRGNPPSGSKVIASSLYDDTGRSWSSYAAESSTLTSYRAAPRSTAKIRPRGFTPMKRSPISAIGLKSGGSPILSPNRFVGSTTKTLIIKHDSLTPKPKTKLLLTNDISRGKKDSSVTNLENGRFESPRTPMYPIQGIQSPSPMMPKPVDSVSPHSGSPSLSRITSPAHDLYRQVVGSPNEPDDDHGSVPKLSASRIHVPKLTKAGYHVNPPNHELEAMTEADLAAVYDFKIERPGYGSIEWEGAVDVRGVDLDSVVVIEGKNVSIYDDAELNGCKPKEGTKLNRPAIITMYGIYPREGAESTPEAKEKLSTKIEKSTKKMGAELISFDADSGTWKFRVGHFSRYGLQEDSDEESDAGIMGTPSLQTVDEEEVHLGGASHIRAPMDEDESSSGAVFHDYIIAPGERFLIEEEDEELDIIRAGDDAYTMMTEQMSEEKVKKDETAFQPYLLEQESSEAVIFFPDEAEEDSMSNLVPISIPVDLITLAPTMGISSKLAKAHSLDKLSASNIVYGSRMRRSFRVGWKPDGSFLHLKPASSVKSILVQSKPIVAAENSKITLIPLLQTHRNHSVPMEGTESGVSLLVFSPAGSCDAIKDYAESLMVNSSGNTQQQAISNTFTLMTCLYGDDQARGKISESRRLLAVSNWLKSVVSADVAKAIAFAQSTGDLYGSIFAAMSGGDYSKASSLALESGHHRLALMIANTGHSMHPFYETQMETWNENDAQTCIPSGILRTFSLARGTLSLEERIFEVDGESYMIDWRRRFGMSLWPCINGPQESSICSFMKHYDACVTDGLAPPPAPLYTNQLEDGLCASKCIFYQILHHYSDTMALKISDIVSPLGYTRFQHDFSASFHIAASVTALTGSSLTLVEENLIIDSLSQQLIMDKCWEWAVYANICSIGNMAASASIVTSKRLRARNIILRFYSPTTDDAAATRRSLLEGFGVPPEWFSEAISYRSAQEGKALTFVENLTKFSFIDSIKAMESIVIPHFILDGKEGRKRLLSIIDSVVRTMDTFEHREYWHSTSLCMPIYDFLSLSIGLEAVLTISRDDIKDHLDDIESMIGNASNLHVILSQYLDKHQELGLAIAETPFETPLTPPAVYLTEICEMLSRIHTQLIALKSGNKIIPDTDLTKCPSQLAFPLNAEGLFESATMPIASGSILRGVCGYNT